MAVNETPSSDRSVHVGGNVTSSAVVTGNSNTVSIHFQQASLPKPEAVDIQTELKALQAILASFKDPVATGVAQKLAQEAQKPEPNKHVVAKTLEMSLTYAKTLSGFAETVDQLRPHIEATAGWLGKHGYKLLPLVWLAL